MKRLFYPCVSIKIIILTAKMKEIAKSINSQITKRIKLYY